MGDALDLLDKIRAKHDRLAEEQRANPRTEWPAGVILFEGGDDGLPPRPADALDEARGLLAEEQRARAAVAGAGNMGAQHDAMSAYLNGHSAAASRALALLPALCEELALRRDVYEAEAEVRERGMTTSPATIARVLNARTALAAWKDSGHG